MHKRGGGDGIWANLIDHGACLSLVCQSRTPFVVLSGWNFWLDEASGLDRSNVGKAGATRPRKYSDYGSVQSPQALYAIVPSAPRDTNA